MPDTDTNKLESFRSTLADIDSGASDTSLAITNDKPAGNETVAAVAPVKAAESAATQKNEPAKAKEQASEPVKASQPNAAKPDDASKSKWAKNEERKATTWAEINANKAALQKERDEIARAKADIEAARNKATADQPYRDEHGISAADYKAIEKQLREKGNTADADAASKLADNIARKEQQVKQQYAQQELATKWKANFSSLQEKHEELKDPQSGLSQETLKVINELPQLTREGDGITTAVRIAQVRIASRDIESTKAENAQLKAQIEQQNKKLSIGGGAPTSPAPDAKPFEKMNAKEREKELLSKLSAADRERGFSAD